jgi:hypothetical protein
LPDRFGGEERLERLGEHVRAHPGAGVGDADADVLAGRHFALLSGVGAVEMSVAGLDRQLAAVRHRVAGVDRQVEDRAFQLVRVALGLPEAAGGDHLELDMLADGPAKQLLHAGDERVRADGLGVERLTAREGEQSVGQRCRPVGRGHRRRGVPPDRVDAPLVDPPLHQFERADHAGQQVVEVVRDAARQLADGFHLLRLAQLLLALTLVRDVPADGVEAVALGHRRPGDGHRRPILLQQAVLERLNRGAPGDRADDLGGGGMVVRGG